MLMSGDEIWENQKIIRTTEHVTVTKDIRALIENDTGENITFGKTGAIGDIADLGVVCKNR
jgi:hypothetical protein